MNVEERLKELSKCELFLDNIFIKDKTARQILVSAYNKLERQQKEIEENQVLIDDIKDHRIVYIDTPEFEEKFISKDKIKEKIKKAKEIKWHTPKLVIEYFEELLEEE